MGVQLFHKFFGCAYFYGQSVTTGAGYCRYVELQSEGRLSAYRLVSAVIEDDVSVVAEAGLSNVGDSSEVH